MAQRDLEDMPEAPDLGATVQLENSESMVGPPGDIEGLDASYVPPDRSYVADRDDASARHRRDGDRLDERLARERAEEEPVDIDRAGRIEMANEGAALETPDAPSGVDVGIAGGAASAEEAAVHVTEKPGGAIGPQAAAAGSLTFTDAAAGAEVAAAERDRAARADAVRDAAAALDANPESSGAAAPASGREDVGPGTGLD